MAPSNDDRFDLTEPKGTRGRKEGCDECKMLQRAPESSLAGLPDCVVREILEWVGTKEFLFVGPVNRRMYNIYKKIVGGFTTWTSYDAAFSSISRSEMILQQYDGMKSIVCKKAARYGHLKVLQWARNEGCAWSLRTCTVAAVNGHLDVLKWARTNGCPWDERTCTLAARGGHLDVLKWARANGCDWDAWTCAYAARGGHLDVLKWARADGCDWDFWTCAFAARRGPLEVLKWALANGCPWDGLTCAHAALGGYLDVLKWARANGCEWECMDCLSAATSRGHLEVVKWLRSQLVGGSLRNKAIDALIVSRARRNRQMHIVEWAQSIGLDH